MNDCYHSDFIVMSRSSDVDWHWWL